MSPINIDHIIDLIYEDALSGYIILKKLEPRLNQSVRNKPPARHKYGIF